MHGYIVPLFMVLIPSIRANTVYSLKYSVFERIYRINCRNVVMSVMKKPICCLMATRSRVVSLLIARRLRLVFRYGRELQPRYGRGKERA